MQVKLKNTFLPTMEEDLASLTIMYGLRMTQLRFGSITAANTLVKVTQNNAAQLFRSKYKQSVAR